jgi:hypothetical protein
MTVGANAAASSTSAACTTATSSTAAATIAGIEATATAAADRNRSPRAVRRSRKAELIVVAVAVREAVQPLLLPPQLVQPRLLRVLLVLGGLRLVG